MVPRRWARALPGSRAYLLLLLSAVIWGATYPIQFTVGNDMGVWGFCGFRYLAGSLFLVPLAVRWRHQRPTEPDPLRPLAWLTGGIICGLVLCFGVALQMYGLINSSSAKGGFITGLYVAFIPIAGLFMGRRPRPGLVAGLAVAIIGLYFLSIPRGSFDFAHGDPFFLAADIFWAAQVILTGWLAPKVNTWLFISAQSLSCSAFCFIAAALTGDFPTLAQVGLIWPAIAWGILSSGLAYYCQTAGQAALPPTPAALIMQLQSLVAAALGWLCFGDAMNGRMIFGAALILAGTAVAQLYARQTVSRGSAS